MSKRKLKKIFKREKELNEKSKVNRMTLTSSGKKKVEQSASEIDSAQDVIFLEDDIIKKVMLKYGISEKDVKVGV